MALKQLYLMLLMIELRQFAARWKLLGKLGEHGGDYFVLNSILQLIFLIIEHLEK